MIPFERTDLPASRRFSFRRAGELEHVRAAELYDAWLFAEADATLALAAWREAAPDDKRRAHAGYAAALDREAHAAHLLELRLLPRP